NFTVPTNFTEDKWVQAIEARPGNRSVVHHILVFAIDPTGAPSPLGYKQVVPAPLAPAGQGGARPAAARPASRQTLIATPAPGTNALVFQPGSAMLLKAGSTIRFQIHYTASGKAATDSSSVGMIFAKEKPATELRDSAFMNVLLKLP